MESMGIAALHAILRGAHPVTTASCTSLLSSAGYPLAPGRMGGAQRYPCCL